MTPQRICVVIVVFFIIHLFISSVLGRLIAPPISFAAETFDPFNTTDGFVRNLEYSSPYVGTYSSVNGILTLTHPPKDYYHQVFIEKIYPVDLTTPTWFHFRFKMKEYLIGQDMYTHFNFIPNNNPGKAKVIVIGINSEQHWQQVYLQQNNTQACIPKTTDDEFFISVSPEIFPDAGDIRLRYPTNFKKKYTDWTLISLKYDPPSPSERGKLSFYFDGQLVENLIPIDEPNRAPINTHTDFFTANQITGVRFGADLLIDGFEHSYTGNKYGIRFRGCYAQKSPAIPGAIRSPSN